MNRLFLKLFGLLVFVVFGSGALVIGFFDYTVFPSENLQLEASIGPGVSALARRIGDGEDPDTVFASARAQVGDTLALLPLALIPVSGDTRRRIEAGEAVIEGGRGRSAWAKVPGRDEVVELAMLSFRGVRVQWMALPETRALGRDATAEERNSLSALDWERLAWRSVLLDHSRVLWREGDQLRVADVPAFYKGREIGMGLTLLGTALAILWSLLPVRRELLELDVGARRLREGDLSARVPVRSAVGPVGEVSVQVNAMADRLQALIAGNEELLRSVSHELQTPLARLLFALDALGTEPASDAELIDGMRASVDELRLLADEVLQFNRLGQAEVSRLELETVDVTELAEDVLLSCGGGELLADGPVFVSGDARLLYRALRNLVENALVYGTPPLVRVDSDAKGVSIHIDDAGPGVPEEERERVFEPFHRLEGSRARATGGTGLGLAIVRRIATRHGGSATVSASPEGGARFTIRVWSSPSPSLVSGAASET